MAERQRHATQRRAVTDDAIKGNHGRIPPIQRPRKATSTATHTNNSNALSA
jgi:hypothetical protein